jgi:eukaryotic-like serine/threonine-protein kinase
MMDRKIAPDGVLPIFAKILDGMEAAHLLGAVHRDLKPENILFEAKANMPAVADFGIASFTDDIVATAVETGPGQKLANFQYAAPEQRTRGREVGAPADIYALGLMLNEMFTNDIPHGTEYQLIGAVQKEYGYLDAVVARMLRQNPADRYQNIAELKGAISHHHAEFENIQKLNALNGVVIPAGEIDDPLAFNPPKISNVYWENGHLTITLDRPVHDGWVRNGLLNMGGHTSVMNIGPERFQFRENIVRVGCADDDAQRVIDYFKQWLPRATQRYKYHLEEHLKRQAHERTEKLKRERAAEEQRLRVNRKLHF